MSADADLSVADNGDLGLTAETAASDRWPVEPAEEHNDWYDLVFVDDVATDLAGVVVQEGTKAEAKTCRRNYGDRRGRWWVCRENHERLVDAGGEYVLSVYDGGTGEILRQALVTARTVDALVGGNWWDAGAGSEAEEFHQLPWSAVFDDVGGEAA